MIKSLERIALTTKNINKCIEFYETLGFKLKVDSGNFFLDAENVRIALNVEEMPNSEIILPLNIQTGCQTFSFICDDSIDNIMKELLENNIKIEGGVIMREGMKGTVKSIIVKDPDDNIVELSTYC